MRERINRLAKGLVDSVAPRIDITPERVELTIRAGEAARGELNIVNEEGLHMKGLVYSFHLRVKVLNATFGGTRGRIGYEVDSSHLSHGDRIEGSFLFVTNGGEKEIPYRFLVAPVPSEQILETLQSGEILGNLARADRRQALHLFDSPDFVNAPFMREDMRARAIYEGLRGSGSLVNQLEEFLVALKLKEPVEFIVDNQGLRFCNPLAAIETMVDIYRGSWGHLNLELAAEGDFIKLDKKTLTDRDFIDDICSVRVRISPEGLHYGKNLGAIRLTSVRTNEVIPVEVSRDKSRSAGRVRPLDFSAYLKMRLCYEAGSHGTEGHGAGSCGIEGRTAEGYGTGSHGTRNHEAPAMLGQMAQELERLRRADMGNPMAALLLAEAWFYQGDKERAQGLASEVKQVVLSQRQEQPGQYLLYLGLTYLLQPSGGQREALSRLLHKYLYGTKRQGYLVSLLLRVEPGLAENPGDLLAKLRHLHSEGNSSPFLYLEAWKIYRRYPALVKKMDAFELQVFYFAVRHDIMTEALAIRAAELAVGAKRYRRLHDRLAARLYGLYPRKVTLEAVCILLIKGDIRGQGEFHWFETALAEGVNLTRLYEYFLYTLPDPYNQLLPREALMYFSYVRDLDPHSRAALYVNIIRYMEPEDPLYRQYERMMEQFTIGQMFESRINSRLAVLYEKFIYKDLIDLPVARVLPSVLCSVRITCTVPGIEYAVLCYEELEGEEVFLLEAGTAYLPLYLENCVLLFQDGLGNRYANLPYRKRAAIASDVSGLLERCFAVFPRHPMLRLRAGQEMLGRGIGSAADLATLEGILADLPLRPQFRRHLVAAMMDCLLPQPAQAGNPAPPVPARAPQPEWAKGPLMVDPQRLWGVLPEELSAPEQGRMIEILILQGHMPEAFRRICQYGWEQVPERALMALCSKLILQNQFTQDAALLQLAYRVFVKGRYDTVILDYLCERFNGSSGQMYQVLKQGIAERSETYDLEERLLAQMLFTGSGEHLDPVFELYVERKTIQENIVKAYFTVKSMEYVVGGKALSRKVLGYLERAALGTAEREKIPALYLLALAKHYAALDKLADKQRQLCEDMVGILLRDSLVLPYFKALGRHVAIPEEYLVSVMAEYRATQGEAPEIEIRLLPQEDSFHREEMDKVFLSVYVKPKQLFDGETMEYRIYETVSGERVCTKEGSIAATAVCAVAGDRRFLALNAMGGKFINKEYRDLKKAMGDYMVESALAEMLFPVN